MGLYLCVCLGIQMTAIGFLQENGIRYCYMTYITYFFFLVLWDST